MKCDDIQNEATLYLYGELAPEDEERIESHLDSCVTCRAELDRLEKIGGLLDGRVLEPSAALLAECRTGLMQEVDRAAAPGRGWQALREGIASWMNPVAGLRRLALAAALVACGFVMARVAPVPRFLPPGAGAAIGALPVSTAGFVPEGVVSSVRYTPDGKVQVDLDHTQRHVISGSPEDDAIQRLLLRAARDQANPGLRVESVTILKDHPGSDAVRQALLQALAADPNPGVRLKALEGLRGLSSQPAVRDALARVLLEDGNPGIRIQAIDVLTADRHEDLVGVLQVLVQTEENPYIRQRSRIALREMNASIGAF